MGSKADLSSDQLTGSCKTVTISALGFQSASGTQNHEDCEISIPAERGNSALHLRDLLTALANSLAEVSLRHTELLAVYGQLIDQGFDQSLLFRSLYKLGHLFILLSYKLANRFIQLSIYI